MRRPFLALSLLALTSTAHAFDITTCGETVPLHETGVLQADLACGAGVGVYIGDRASLDLNGHAIAAPAGEAIVCAGPRCVITSTGAPGDVSGSPSVDCITTWRRGKLELDNLYVHDCRTCIETNPDQIHLRGSHVIANDVTVDTCRGPGIDARKLRATNVSVTHAQNIAIWAEMMLQGDGITANDNTGVGIFAVQIKADNVVANNNGWYGVEAFKMIRIRGGEMLGNALYDIAATRVKLEGVTCGNSRKFNSDPMQTLGVCTND